MRVFLARLWADDRGALLSIEFLLVSSILVLGLVVGLATLRNALVTELTELSNSVLTLNGGASGSSGATQQATPPQPLAPTSVSDIDVNVPGN
jgi:Flp pilus assembly pilin Flp